MSQINKEGFIRYAKKILKEGVKVCPCCLYDGLEFYTDDEHSEYSIECKMCHIGMRNHLFRRTIRSWNHRRLDDERINRITHNIECSWFDGENTEYITIDDVEDVEKEEMETV